MFRKMYLITIGILALLSTGCAVHPTMMEVEEKQPVKPPKHQWNVVTCENTDWYALGLSEGEGGRVHQKIEKIAYECAEQGVIIKTDQYLKGLESRARTYCTPLHGQQLGLQGKSYPSLCKPEIYSEFYFEWYRGIQQYCHSQAKMVNGNTAICRDI